MANEHPSTVPSEASCAAAGRLLVASSIVGLVVMAFHPTAHAHNPAQFVKAISNIAVLDRLIHGGLIALSGLQFVGLWAFANRLGLGALSVRSGLVAYVLGTAAMTAAALTNGFVLPDLASRYEDALAAELEALGHLLRLCRSINQVCAETGLIALSASALLWSLALVRRPNEALAGATGLVLALLPPVALLSGRLTMNLHGMLAFLAAQTVWNCLAAGLMIGRRR